MKEVSEKELVTVTQEIVELWNKINRIMEKLGLNQEPENDVPANTILKIVGSLDDANRYLARISEELDRL